MDQLVSSLLVNGLIVLYLYCTHVLCTCPVKVQKMEIKRILIRIRRKILMLVAIL